jgi:hypothetical protein
VIGETDENHLKQAGMLMLRYSQKPLPPFCEIETRSREGTGQFTLAGQIQEEWVETLRVV